MSAVFVFRSPAAISVDILEVRRSRVSSHITIVSCWQTIASNLTTNVSLLFKTACKAKEGKGETNKMATPKVTLYTYFRSSCSARLRIALHLKSIPFSSRPVNLLKNEQNSQSHTSINPSAAVPVMLVHHDPSKAPIAITQSLAALEYLDEMSPSSTSPTPLPPLMPMLL